MTSIGEQAREAAARTQAASEYAAEKNSDGKEQARKSDKESEKRKATTRERVAATAEAILANRYMPGSNIHNPGDALISQLRDPSMMTSSGGEVDLTERDAFKTLSKVTHHAVELPMGGLAMAIRHEFQEASGLADKAATSDAQPPVLDQIKSSFKEGLQSTKPTARRQKSEGMEL